MAEENQVQLEPQQIITKKLKKVEAGKRLADHSRRKREEKKREELKVQVQKGELNQSYGIGAIIVVGVIGGLGYYIYRTKKGEVNTILNNPPHHPPKQPRPQFNKFEID